MEVTTIALEGSVRASQVAHLYATAQEAIEDERHIDFDFQTTTDIDASVLQLLIAVHAVANDRFSFHGVSPELNAKLERYGITELPMWQRIQSNPTAPTSASETTK